MNNLSEIRDYLQQIQLAVLEIGKGCEEAQHRDIDDKDIENLVLACRELLGNAETIQAISKEAERSREEPGVLDPFIPSPRDVLLGDLRACGYDASFHAKSGQIRVFLNGRYFKVAGGTAPHPTLIEVLPTEL